MQNPSSHIRKHGCPTCDNCYIPTTEEWIEKAKEVHGNKYDYSKDCGFYHLIVEVDENKHRGADYKCDERRMYDIIAKLGLPCIFIRYNPDSKESNKDILLQKVQQYLELDIEDNIWDKFGFKVEYLFY